MNINALTNVADQYIQSLMGVSSNSTSSTAGATATAPQDAAPQLSPFAQAIGGAHRHGHHHFHLHTQSPAGTIISDTLRQAGISLSQSSGSTGS